MRTPAARAMLLLLPLLGLALMGCAAVMPSAPAAPREKTPTADRNDCAAIFGTAFASDAERDWFAENCSQWPSVNIADPPSLSDQPALDPHCYELMGKPYANDDDRRWFLSNCIGNGQTAQAQTGNNSGNPADTQDRTDCNAIRGTPYRSANERNWFLANCPTTTVTGPTITTTITIPFVPQNNGNNGNGNGNGTGRRD
jgi:hypothetical protein